VCLLANAVLEELLIMMAPGDLDKKYLLHPFSFLKDYERFGGVIISRGEGCYIWDVDGNKYLDAMAGLWCVNIGYGNEQMAEAVKEQIQKLSYAHVFTWSGTDVSSVLAHKLLEIASMDAAKVFFASSGSEANDTQIKLVWYYNNVLGRPQKKKIIARERGYHGTTLLAGSLTGLDSAHNGFDLPLSFVKRVSSPYSLWARPKGLTDAEFSKLLAEELENLIINEGPDTVAAFIAEPIQAAGGVIVPPQGYFEAVQHVLKKYDVLMIADEVVCAFGRLGKWFGSQVFDIKPDLITVGKGITSGYLPLSGCLISSRVWEVIRDGQDKFGLFGHGYTFSAHPVAAAAALKNIEIIDRDNIFENVSQVGPYLQDALRQRLSDHPNVAEVRGTGLIAAVELVQSKEPLVRFDKSLRVGARVFKKCLDKGVVTRILPDSDSIAISPPLIITKDQVDTIVDTLEQSINEVVAKLKL